MYKPKINAALLVILAVTFVGQVSAEEEWEHTLSPLYLWAVGMEGESQIGPVTAPVSVEFSDALDNLDTILTFHYEAHKGQWGLLVDFMHISLDPESTLPTGAPAGVDLTNNIIELGGLYRFSESDSTELIFGLRFSEFELDATIGPMPKATLADESWLDGFVGLRTTIPVSDQGKFILRGDVGGGDSNFVWNAMAVYDHRFKENFSAVIGYRWLDYDFETGSGPSRFTYDITYEGPILGAVFYW